MKESQLFKGERTLTDINSMVLHLPTLDLNLTQNTKLEEKK